MTSTAIDAFWEAYEATRKRPDSYEKEAVLDGLIALQRRVSEDTERALAEQREGIAKAIEQANENDPQHCYDDTSGSLSRGYQIAADEARRYGKEN
jgi:hypothetical protein